MGAWEIVNDGRHVAISTQQTVSDGQSYTHLHNTNNEKRKERKFTAKSASPILSKSNSVVVVAVAAAAIPCHAEMERECKQSLLSDCPEVGKHDYINFSVEGNNGEVN